MSFSTYTAKRKLNRLRRSACQLFTSEAMVKAIQRLELEVEAKRLLVRKDRHLWKDIGERQKTIYGELISLESNNIAAEFRHPKVPHLYKMEALSRYTLKKLLLLVCFLDKAKESRLIEHDPCLFCMDAEFKTSKDLLLAFSRDFLSGEGILPRHLGYLGLPVSHAQTPLDEFNFAVNNLAVDLRCGIRLVRVMELFSQDWNLSRRLRMPAISRLQKVHNVDIALQVLKTKGVDLKDEHGSVIEARDIVDGHREKTLSLLWKIIFAFQVILNEEELREEIGFLKRTLRTKQSLAALRADRGLRQNAAKPSCAPYEHSSTKITLLMDWVNAVCDFYNLRAENFTVSFSDGRILCYLIHHYHPSHLPEEAVSHCTTQTVESSDSDDSFDSTLEAQNVHLRYVEQLLENEKNNFRLVNSAVAFLGGVPAMITPSDMSNTIPSEKVVMSYLSFLCSRLLDLRNETRAARVIQGAWRKYRLKKDYQDLRQATIKIQAAYRGFRVRDDLKKRNSAATVIQALFRMHKVRMAYLATKCAAIIVQERYRAKRLRDQQMQRYRAMKAAAIVIQAAYRGHRVRLQVAQMHRAATVIQRRFVTMQYRKRFLAMKAAALLCQRRYRAVALARKEHKKYILKLQHHSAIVIQSAFRGHAVRKQVAKMGCASVIIQRWFRASVKRDMERQKFVQMKSAAITIQAAYRGHTARELLKKQHKAATVIQTVFRKHAANRHYLALKTATIIIQHKYRAKILAQKAKREYNALRHSAVTIQAMWRGRADRKRLEKLHQCATLIQSHYRRHTAQTEYRSRKAAAVVIQHHFRAYKAGKMMRTAYLQEKAAAATLQALWRGHRSRRLNDNPKVVKVRQRLRQVSAGAREEDKLCNKTSSALDYLLRYKHFSCILEALKNLETATRLSPECCERLVESGATLVIFTLIRSCNRSVPCMDVITYSIQILLNLSKYHKTIESVFTVENSVETLLDLLQRYREKAGDKVAEKGGSIFTKACFLLALLLQDQHRALEVRKLPKALDKISSIYRLTVRKHKMDAERTVIKQKMNASINGSFLVQSTPRKSRPVPKFAPDWVLRKDKLKDIVDPLRAIQMVADTLAIVL
uniref:Calponin-homology (CH) domain-containing protein n=1 Tax=Myripristis murdjan TaxID=586833 RepID=A0A668AAY2_9TELE